MSNPDVEPLIQSVESYDGLKIDAIKQCDLLIARLKSMDFSDFDLVLSDLRDLMVMQIGKYKTDINADRYRERIEDLKNIYELLVVAFNDGKIPFRFRSTLTDIDAITGKNRLGALQSDPVFITEVIKILMGFVERNYDNFCTYVENRWSINPISFEAYNELINLILRQSSEIISKMVEVNRLLSKDINEGKTPISPINEYLTNYVKESIGTYFAEDLFLNVFAGILSSLNLKSFMVDRAASQGNIGK